MRGLASTQGDDMNSPTAISRHTAGTAHPHRPATPALSHRRKDPGGHQDPHPGGCRQRPSRPGRSTTAASRPAAADAIEKAVGRGRHRTCRNPAHAEERAALQRARFDFAMPEVADGILGHRTARIRGEAAELPLPLPVVARPMRWQMILPHALMCYGSRPSSSTGRSIPRTGAAATAPATSRRCRWTVAASARSACSAAASMCCARRTRRPLPRSRDLPAGHQTRQLQSSPGASSSCIPGIATLGAVELATNGFYSMPAAREALETVAVLPRGASPGSWTARRASGSPRS
ncbi:MAG: hypothetical protein MZW92_68065 [Comamonadaceae bacterium]|nr:hypothetical protein [Comamonadaceae bacterium]